LVAFTGAGIVLLTHAFYHERASIPQDEIDAEVRRILIEHPDDPVSYAAVVVERLQCARTTGDW